MDIMEIVLVLPILLLSLSFHEYSHGKASYLLGDPTPKMMGRLTLNPLAHLDFMGTLVLIITRRIGWAKPVPVNPRYYQNPRKGLMLVGMAGPGANIVLALGFSLLSRFFSAFSGIPIRFVLFYGPSNYQEIILYFLFLGIVVNLSLAIFNLLPIPPLDGSKILRGFLPPKYDQYLYQLEGPVGMIILMLLAFTGILMRIISPVLYFFLELLV